MHCNLRPPQPHQLFPALITTPCQVWSRWTYPLPYYSVFAADTLLYVVTLTFDLRHWTSAAYHPWRDETLYQIWTQSNNPRRSYCDFSVWPYDLEHCVTCCARLWGNFHQVWSSTSYLRAWIIAFWYVMSCCDLDLWPADLESSWNIKRHVIKVCRKFERNRAIPGWIIDNLANFSTPYLTLMYPWPLTSWSWTVIAHRMSCV